MYCQIFDPRKEEMEQLEIAPSYSHLEKKAEALRVELISEQKAAGKKDPEVVAVIHRKTREVRRFDLGPRAVAAVEYCALLLRGVWRLASAAEDAAARKAEQEHRTAKAAKHFERRQAAAKVLAEDAKFGEAVDLVNGATPDVPVPHPAAPAFDAEAERARIRAELLAEIKAERETEKQELKDERATIREEEREKLVKEAKAAKPSPKAKNPKGEAKA